MRLPGVLELELLDSCRFEVSDLGRTRQCFERGLASVAGKL